MPRWHKVLDDKGETSEVYFHPRTRADKRGFTDRQPYIPGYVRFPDGDIFKCWWPIFTEWFV